MWMLPPALVAYGRYLPTRGTGIEVVHVAEGLTEAREQFGVHLAADRALLLQKVDCLTQVTDRIGPRGGLRSL